MSAPGWMLGVAGLERLFTICFHTAMMVLLLLFVEKKRTAAGFCLVVALHTALDLCAALFGQSRPVLCEIVIALAGTASVLFCVFAKKWFPTQENQNPQMT